MSGKSAVPSSFGRYQVLGELGTGAMGQVYLAMDGRLGRPVAIKVLRIPPEYDHTPEEFEVRFRREAEAVGRLSHPNIVQVFDIGPNFIVMEYIEGETLFTVLKRRRPMSLRRVATVVQGVAEALDYAHAHGIVHRDVKPANVMITGDGVVKVMDFGVARLDDSKLTVVGTVMGSVQYMAPEQMTGGTVDGRADVFSLAAVAYEMLTGQAPFPGKTITEVISLAVQEKFLPPRSQDARLPESINRVFLGALTREPARRYQKATSFSQDLLASLHPVLDLAAAMPALAQPNEKQRSPSLPTPAGGTLFVDPSKFAPLAAEMIHEGVLILESEPRGAKVFVNGYEVGQTPIAKVDTRLGSHSIVFEAEGHVSLTIQAELTGERPIRLVNVTLAPAGAARGVYPGKFVPLGPGVMPPVRVSGAVPSYPEDARRRGLGGICVVEFWISEVGEVHDVAVVSSAGSLLDAAVVEAVESWRFTPARLNGVPVSMQLTAQHVFGASG